MRDHPADPMSRAAVALGSNLGDRLGHLRWAVGRLGELGEVVAVSGLYETEPVGPPGQDPYLNAVVVLDTRLSPSDLLSALQGIELEAGRRRGERWGPRTLDLDLVVYEDLRISLPGLEIPHPRARERRFVLAPLVEVWPEAEVAPGSTALGALADLPRRPWVYRFAGDWVKEPPHLGKAASRWVLAQGIVLAGYAGALLAGASWDPVWWRWTVGGALVAGGGLMMGAAARALGKDLTPLPQPRPGARLVEGGPYRRVRHPMYGGLLLGMLGASLAAASLPGLAMTVVAAGFFRAKSTVEERAIGAVIPGYLDYRKRVRRRFVPYLW